MRIDGWECIASPDGLTRHVAHAENGSATYMNGRLVGHCDLPREVLRWLIRPLLRHTWDAACLVPSQPNPYEGEPPNKDNDPS